MFEILIVEDNSEKLRSILTALELIQDLNVDDVETYLDASSAKKRIKEKKFDVLILDVSIPFRKSEEIDPTGGIKLLDEILNREGYNVPTHIIGLTANERVFTESTQHFGEKILSVIKFELANANWKNLLVAGIEHRISAKKTNDALEPPHSCDAIIICALDSELNANRNNGWDWAISPAPLDDTIYYEAKFSKTDGSAARILAAQSNRMGMPAATALTTKMILIYKPRYVIMTGIMAGIKGKVNLGDLIVANPVWDWGSGKWTGNQVTPSFSNITTENYNTMFQIEPFQFSVDTKVLKEISILKEDNAFLFETRKKYPLTFPKHDVDIHVGPVASGASVLSNPAILNEIRTQNRKLLGIDMEAYGLFCATETAPRPKTSAFCIKSVVDFGDEDKNDSYQHFGCYMSAMVAKKIIENLINNHKK